MFERKFFFMSILSGVNALFMFISLASYTGSNNKEAAGAALSALIAWSWLSFMFYIKNKKGQTEQ